MKSTSGNFSFHGYVMALVAVSISASLIFAGLFVFDQPNTLFEWQGVLAVYGILGIGSLIVFAYSMPLSFTPFSIIMGLWGATIHASRWIAVATGALLGIVLVVPIIFLLSFGSVREGEASYLGIFAFFALGAFTGAIGGLTYFYVSKRDPYWKHPNSHAVRRVDKGFAPPNHYIGRSN